jgi:hypothetical protein
MKKSPEASCRYCDFYKTALERCTWDTKVPTPIWLGQQAPKMRPDEGVFCQTFTVKKK